MMEDRHRRTLEWVASHDPLPIRPGEMAGGVFPLSSEYLELFWTPIIGPTSVMALRRFGAWLSVEPAGFSVGLEELARALGLSPATTPRSAVCRVLGRLESYGLARVTRDAYAPATLVRPLKAREVAKLPAGLQRALPHEVPA